MQDFDRGFKEVARRSGPELARLAGVETDHWTPIVSEVQILERFADRAFRARRAGESFLVYFEAYTRWDKRAPWNMLTKSSALSERHRLPTVPVAYILAPGGFEMRSGKFRLEVAGKLTQQLNIRSIALWERKPDREVKSSRGLLTMFPLFKHGLKPERAVEFAAAAIREMKPPEIDLANDLFLLSVFSRLAFRGPKWDDIIGKEEIMASSIFSEFIRKGIRKGIRQGVRQGELSARRDDVREILLRRFGQNEADSVRETVLAIEDSQKLQKLLITAAVCPSPAEFREALAAEPIYPKRTRTRP